MVQKINWVKYLTALLVIPAIIFIPRLFGGNEVSAMSENGTATWSRDLVQGVGMYVALFLIAIFYWSDGILKPSWQKWRQHWVWYAFFAFLAAILMMVVLVPALKSISHTLFASMLVSTVLPTLLVLTIPLLQAFTEEIVYHHALIAPFAENKILYVVMSFVSNLVFAAVHINNVDGSIPNLLMYFMMGVFFQLMYHFGNKNIWQNIMTHLFYNGFITVIGLIGLIITVLMN